MSFPSTAKINKKGRLEIGGADTVELAKKFGTPLYVIDEASVRDNCRRYTGAFKGYPGTEIIYAGKALSVTGLLKVLRSEGIGMDVASGGELYTALRAGCDPRSIYFHGNNKTKEEISYGVSSGVTFVVDNLDELEALEAASKVKRVKTPVLFRVNPGIEAHTHDFIKTGAVDSKFGLSKKQALKAVGLSLGSPHLVYKGLHGHIGSQIFEKASYVALVQVLLDLFRKIKQDYGAVSEVLDIGGGIGIAYTKDSRDPDLRPFAEKIIKTVRSLSKSYGLKLPKLVLEPGRSIIGNAGVTLYTVGTVKEIRGIRKYVIVDGGMTDNPRFILYGSRYEAILANRAKARPESKATIAGRACESGDVIIKDYFFPEAKKGDTIAVACTGAYNYSMASNYNKFLRPAVIIVKKGVARTLVKRETFADLVRNEL